MKNKDIVNYFTIKKLSIQQIIKKNLKDAI